MRLSSVLLGGLVWKKMRPTQKIKARRRKHAARVARIENFLKQYPMNRWRSTLYRREYWQNERRKQGLPLYELSSAPITKK
jgi:hypothetical protein